ncbi:MAG TPA: tRNA pseudouridine(55) synthase TruB [Tenuifilaceae bacterium]|nr:tRNA pseudouridine(55) synthase TruB [Tenuifilaceae bacterium]
MIFTFNKDTDWNEGVVLLFDKPYGWTSYNLVGKVRAVLKHRLGLKKIKVGHAGTLDPLATGLLVICVGKATKRVSEFQMQDKEYVATFSLGATTPSFDLETQKDKDYPTGHINRELINRVLPTLAGAQMQVPPLFSAKSVEGGRAYLLARKGIDMELAPSPVTIHQLEVLHFELPNLTLKIRCSKGTYIRALARDIGIALGSGAHLTELRRTASGDFRVDEAMEIENFEKIIFDL